MSIGSMFFRIVCVQILPVQISLHYLLLIRFFFVSASLPFNFLLMFLEVYILLVEFCFQIVLQILLVFGLHLQVASFFMFLHVYNYNQDSYLQVYTSYISYITFFLIKFLPNVNFC